MESKGKKLKISEKSLRTVEGIFICLLAVFGMLNYGVVSQFFFWCISFFVGSLFTYVFYVIVFLFGLSFIFKKKIAVHNIKFGIIGIVLLSIGVLIITTTSISYLDDGSYMTFNTFKEVYIKSLNLSSFPKINITTSGGLIGYVLVGILNTAFTDVGSKSFGGILIAVGTFFIIFRPLVSLIRSIKEIPLKKSKNLEEFGKINDEDLLINDANRTITSEYFEKGRDDGNEDYFNSRLQISEKEEENITPYKVEESKIASKEETISEVKKEKVEPILSNPFEEIQKEEVKAPVQEVKQEKATNKPQIQETNGLRKVRFSLGDNSFSNNENNSRYESSSNFYNNNEDYREEENINYDKPKIEKNNEVLDTFYSNSQENEHIVSNPEPKNNFNNSNDNSPRVESRNNYNNSEVVTQKVNQNVEKPSRVTEALNNVTSNKTKGKIKYVVPPTNLLVDRNSQEDDQNNIIVCDQRMTQINQVLEDFKIGARIVSYKIGPSVTRFDLQTDRGVSINGFDKYVSDISIRLGGLEARFVPLVQGKSTSGIEIANENRSLVNFKDVFEHLPTKKPGQFYIPFGKNISGDFIQADLAEFPHMLVCGTTRSGKSIFMHSVILSLMMRSPIDELRLVMIDPKRVEFGKYKDEPHLLCPIISDPNEANATLLKLVDEMEDRFTLLEDSGVSNIKQYNEDAKIHNHDTLPYILVVIDEFADLIDNVKAVAQPVQRLGQKARAAGIHMIIATQRPSTDVISGTIKANLGVRAVLMTSSSTDSVVALGEGGAEKLLGNGDMLVSCPMVSKGEKLRVQGCFVDNNEILNVVNYLKERYPLEYNQKFMNLLDKTRMNENDYGVIHQSNDEDEKYEDIKRYIMETKEYCSISMIQREFSFGFTRSSKIFNKLKDEGIIEKATSGNNAKGAKVLIHLGSFSSSENQSSEGNPGSYSQSTFESK